VQDAAPSGPAEVETIDLETVLHGQSGGLTAEDAARRAVATAPSLDSARAQLTAAQSGAQRALQAFVPRVELSGRYTRLSEITPPSLFGDPAVLRQQLEQARIVAGMVSDPAAQQLFLANIAGQEAQANFTFPVILDQFALGASLTVPVTDLFLQVWPAYEAADGAARAVRYQIRARASEVAQQAREAFYAYARARGALAIATAAVAAVEMQEDLVEALVRAGTTAHVDLARVQAQVAAAHVAALRTEAGVRIAETAVRTLLHSEDPVAIGEDLLAPVPPPEASREALVAQALTHRAEPLALRTAIGARGRQIDAAEGSRWPHLVLVGNLTYANPNQRFIPQSSVFRETWDVSAVLTWSPNDFFTGERVADDARAQRGQAEADLRALEDGIGLQVTQAYENLRAAQAAMQAAEAGVAAAEEALEVRTQQYRAGATIITEVILAVNERARAELDLLNAALDARVARAQLDRAIGADGPYDGIE